MPGGSCFCGNVRVSYEGEPSSKAVCHCTDCRKISGSVFGVEVLVPSPNFRLDAGEASLKTISRPGGSGRAIVSHFCGDCGTTMWRDGPAFAGRVIIKIGVLDDLDDIVDRIRPEVEVFCRSKIPWVPDFPGAVQRMTMT